MPYHSFKITNPKPMPFLGEQFMPTPGGILVPKDSDLAKPAADHFTLASWMDPKYVIDPAMMKAQFSTGSYACAKVQQAEMDKVIENPKRHTSSEIRRIGNCAVADLLKMRRW